MSTKSKLNTALKEAEGLGSAHHGVQHWLAQRVSAVALIPLMVWFVVVVLRLSRADYVQVVDFFKLPINAVLMALLIGFSFYHAALGLQEVIEDYVHCKIKKAIALLIVKFGLLAIGVVTLLAIVKMHLA